MTILGSIFLALAIAYLVITAEALLTGGKMWLSKTETSEVIDGEVVTTTTRNTVAAKWIVAGVASGIMAGVINALTAKVPMWANIMFLVLLGLGAVALAYWWFREGGKVAEYIPFFLLFGLLGIVVNAVAEMLGVTLWTNMVLSVLSGVTLIALFFKRSKINAADGKPGWARAQKIIAWVLIILLVLGQVVTLVLSIRGLPKKEPVEIVEDSVVETVSEIPVEVPVVVPAWYQLNALDEHTEPGNFGPTPEIDWETATGKDVWQVFKDVVFGGGLYQRPDPNVGTSFAYYNDSATGKRILAYTGKDDMDAITNQIAYMTGMKPGTEANRTDSSAYYVMMNQAIKSVEQYSPTFKVYTTAELKKLKMTVKDQLYADYNGMQVLDDQGIVTDVKMPVVWECEMAEEDHFLYISYYIKGRHVELWLHVECLFQPCNASDHMKVEVKPNPVTPKKSTPPPADNGGATKQSTDNGGSTKQSTDDGGAAKQQPVQETVQGGTNKQQTTVDGGANKTTLPTTNPKDTTRGPDVGRNIQSGPDKDTNNGVGATVGRDDNNYTNTVQSGATLPQIQQKYDMLEEFNQNSVQLPGGTENIPLSNRPDTKLVDQTSDKEMRSNQDAVAKTGGQTLANHDEQTSVGAWKPSSDIASGADVSVSEVGISAEQRRKQLQQQQAQQAQVTQSAQTQSAQVQSAQPYTSYNNGGVVADNYNYGTSNFGGLDYGGNR